MEGIVERSIIINKNITYSTLLKAIDRVSAALGVQGVKPCVTYAGIRVPTNKEASYLTNYKTLSFETPWAKVPVHWRIYFQQRASHVIFAKGAELKMVFSTEKGREKWTDDEIKKTIDNLFEINSEN